MGLLGERGLWDSREEVLKALGGSGSAYEISGYRGLTGAIGTENSKVYLGVVAAGWRQHFGK